MRNIQPDMFRSPQADPHVQSGLYLSLDATRRAAVYPLYSSSAVIDGSGSLGSFSVLFQVMASEKVLNKIRHDDEIAQLPMLILDVLL